MQDLVLILMLAVIVEAVVEYGKSIGKAFLSGGVKTAVTQLCAILLGIALCFTCGGNLFALAGVPFSHPWIGMVLTGVIISRGANYVSDFSKKLQAKKEG